MRVLWVCEKLKVDENMVIRCVKSFFTAHLHTPLTIPIECQTIRNIYAINLHSRLLFKYRNADDHGAGISQAGLKLISIKRGIKSN